MIQPQKLSDLLFRLHRCEEDIHRLLALANMTPEAAGDSTLDALTALGLLIRQLEARRAKSWAPEELGDQAIVVAKLEAIVANVCSQLRAFTASDIRRNSP